MLILGLAALLAMSAVALAGEQGRGPSAEGFDRLADQLDRGELVITTNADAHKLLDQLKRQIPAGDVKTRLGSASSRACSTIAIRTGNRLTLQ